MAEIFISHIHEEEGIASAIQSFLVDSLPFAKDIFVSSDKWKIFAGEIWLDRIEAELEEAKVVILLLSRISVGRPWVNFEAGAAWLKKKAIIPCCYGGLSKDELPKPYSGIQALNLPDELYYLLASISHHLNKIPLPPRLLAARILGGTEALPANERRLIESIQEYEKELNTQASS